MIGIVLTDPREKDFPKAGLVQFKDAETNQIRYIDTSNKNVRNEYFNLLKKIVELRNSVFISSRIDKIEIDAGESYIKPLVNFFKLRERRL